MIAAKARKLMSSCHRVEPCLGKTTKGSPESGAGIVVPVSTCVHEPSIRTLFLTSRRFSEANVPVQVQYVPRTQLLPLTAVKWPRVPRPCAAA
jgi:hypothetical protein